MTQPEQQPRSQRNRKRPNAGGRRIQCPIDGCTLESASQKYRLYADSVAQLQQHGLTKRQASLTMTIHSAVLLESTWLEAFWCSECEAVSWYQVRKQDKTFTLSLVTDSAWLRSIGTTDPRLGNPSVSEFSRRQSRPLCAEI
jgi:hypothetical protein